MAHRAKHLRRNWIPERLAKAEECAVAAAQRQAEAAFVRAMRPQTEARKNDNARVR